MNYGTKPIELDSRDYSFHKTFQTYGAVALPNEINLDAGLWMPNQNEPNPIFDIPAQPYGCTNYTTCALGSDEDKVLYNPGFQEYLTNASANGGYDVRRSLLTSVNIGLQTKDEMTTIEAAKHKRPAMFRIGQNPDHFDGARTALAMGRPVSAGSPWFTIWGATDSSGIANEDVIYNPNEKYGWHNFEINGCTTKNTEGKLIRSGEVFLKIKSWQGAYYGDKGWMYWSRPLTNKVFEILNAGMFTVAKPEGTIKTVGMDYIFLKNLGFQMTDPEVADLQKALQSLGYNIPHAVTTVYGVETKTALAKFQAEHRIKDDGSHFGPQTRFALNSILNPAQTLLGTIVLFARSYLGV